MGSKMNRFFMLATLLGLMWGYNVLAEAQACDPGTIAAPASFEGVIRPALALDVNPADDIVEINLTAREATWDFDIPFANRVPPTSIYTYNGVTPGPMIEANVGDTLVVNFCNDLDEPTTIHWHGLETPEIGRAHV